MSAERRTCVGFTARKKALKTAAVCPKRLRERKYSGRRVRTPNIRETPFPAVSYSPVTREAIAYKAVYSGWTV